MKSLVEVKDLAVSFYTYAGEIQAVRGISFDISEGKTVALVGESGCGKSVTAKTLLGLIEKPGKVKNGSAVFFKEKNILNNSKKEWNDFRGKECSMIFQDAKLIAIEGSIPDMTNPPKGCGFCARCPYAMKICEEYEPPRTQLGEEHEISCWLMHEKADRSGLPYEIVGGKRDE